MYTYFDQFLFSHFVIEQLIPFDYTQRSTNFSHLPLCSIFSSLFDSIKQFKKHSFRYSRLLLPHTGSLVIGQMQSFLIVWLASTSHRPQYWNSRYLVCDAAQSKMQSLSYVTLFEPQIGLKFLGQVHKKLCAVSIVAVLIDCNTKTASPMVAINFFMHIFWSDWSNKFNSCVWMWCWVPFSVAI